jgi:hypothetical protein
MATHYLDRELVAVGVSWGGEWKGIEVLGMVMGGKPFVMGTGR